LINHLRGRQVLHPPSPRLDPPVQRPPDLSDLKGQETARRVLEIAAAGGHNLLMVGPPGAGESMLAARLAGLLPPLTPSEALDVTMLHSVAGKLRNGGLIQTRPFRAPHYSASMAALVGGGMRAAPGEISLAHHGVLFLDELAEFTRPALDSLRQPLETAEVVVARANHHVTYPANFQLVAAMNPCRCGFLGDPARACGRAPACGRQYSARISGPMLDRFDLMIEVPEVSAQMLLEHQPGEASATVAARVRIARDFAASRNGGAVPNANLTPDQLDGNFAMTDEARDLLKLALERARLSARGYHKMLRVARTIADLAAEPEVTRPALAEALAYREMPLLA
jgi:magnesium chelatase family protein